MAGFRMHVSTSSLLGCGYTGVLHALYGVPLPTATVAGAMCGFSGMLPDLDSDTGVPLREAMGFSAATIPMLLIGHFQSLALSRDTIIVIGVLLYLFVRFGIANMIRKHTVHRGMFHSIPAMLIFGGIAFLVTGTSPLNDRIFKAGGVMGGFLSHLILDEIYAVEFKSGRWRTKKSFGTALKLWGGDGWSNFATYAKLAIVGMGIVGQPGVMKQLGANQPQFASQFNEALNLIGTLGKKQPQLANQFNELRNLIGSAASQLAPQNGPNGAPFATAPSSGQFPFAAPSANNPSNFPAYSATAPQPPATAAPKNNQPAEWQWPVASQSYNNAGQPATFQNQNDTAQRPTPSYSQ